MQANLDVSAGKIVFALAVEEIELNSYQLKWMKTIIYSIKNIFLTHYIDFILDVNRILVTVEKYFCHNASTLKIYTYQCFDR